MMNLTVAQTTIIAQLATSDKLEFTPKELISLSDSMGIARAEVYRLIKNTPKTGRGIYNLSALILPLRGVEVEQPTITNEKKPALSSSSIQSVNNDEVFVPSVDKYYIQWGNYKDIESIVKSQAFYPTYITGLSGNGKTTMVEQACAKVKREYVRVQITPETDEDDLIGGFRLINGETVFAKGPVLKAMEAGAILLIDEIDRGSNKMMCLQGVLEGKPVLIKKTGQVVTPAAGFNIIATANTKGKGSEDGRFVAATIIDEAFLERFTITVDQEYPNMAIEKRIVIKHMEKYDCLDNSFADMLTTWSDTIRKTYEDGGVDEIISTRRLCHIVQTYSIFKDRSKAIQLCVNRFDADTKAAFIDLYTKVDASVQPSITTVESEDKLSSVIDNALNVEVK
jgi:midasin (ATPase involved in ribosome maturation)